MRPACDEPQCSEWAGRVSSTAVAALVTVAAPAGELPRPFPSSSLLLAATVALANVAKSTI